MSNRKKAPDAVRRAAQHRQGRGRHREPVRSPGDLVAVPGQAGLKILAAGARAHPAAVLVGGIPARPASAAPWAWPVTTAAAAH